jgi:hypothetical protein
MPPATLLLLISKNISIKQKHIIMRKYDRFNKAKFKLLHWAHVLEKAGVTINSVTLSQKTGKPNHIVLSLLYRYSVELPYFRRYLDNECHNSCTVKYRLTKQGKSVYQKLLPRYLNGLDLNLNHLNPKKVLGVLEDFT